jgi:hypothetical protein
VAVSSEIRQDLIAGVGPADQHSCIENGIDISPFAQARSAETLKAGLGIIKMKVVD